MMDICSFMNLAANLRMDLSWMCLMILLSLR